MTMRDDITRAFGKARDYDGNARIQRDVAQALAARIAALDLPADPRVLEIGCGTGFLTQQLMDAGIGGTWTVTDIAPAMVERCRSRLNAPSPGTVFATLDGERGTPPARPFDLVCSSLAIQWFDDAAAALARWRDWLAPGGHIVVTTLGPDTFREWRSAHEAEGLIAGTPRFSPVEALAALKPEALVVEEHIERHDSPRAFLKALKAIGAGTSAPAHKPLSPSQMRQVMRRFDRSGCEVTYQVVTCHLRAGVCRL